ncbi:Os10g0159033 [Oryza sativa Japonica Group]|uniref:Os10g0159033 protein n=2 Tax=Oryza sativa subsp. japonica TaxID=39947 RepID=C7J7U5_ORYSJ|nr:Os10g0159033 [Oryza sativa Japonica Group]BAT09966.1 Os10g0159033 [Oryza sativa Japonica Group]|eukprot:NP_001176033.1 Os10g0159033 [Oryza sativa Japonica Group]
MPAQGEPLPPPFRPSPSLPPPATTLPHFLHLPPPSSGVHRSGTRFDAGVTASPPLEPGRPLSSSSLFDRREERGRDGRKKKEREKRKERLTDRTASSIGIQGADVDPDGYAKAAENLKAQEKTC